LAELSKLVTGLTSKKIRDIERQISEMDDGHEGTFQIRVGFGGRPATVTIDVYMSDEAAPDICFKGPTSVIAALERQVLKE
jgi:hypothetical protein